MNRDVPSQPDFGERPYFQPLFKPVHFGDSTSERREMPRLPDAPQPTSPLLPDHPHHPKYTSDKEKVSSLSWRSEPKRKIGRASCRERVKTWGVWASCKKKMREEGSSMRNQQ